MTHLYCTAVYIGIYSRYIALLPHTYLLFTDNTINSSFIPCRVILFISIDCTYLHICNQPVLKHVGSPACYKVVSNQDAYVLYKHANET
jgi:hypothetical protein